MKLPRTLAIFAIICALIAAGGCVRYVERPLSSEAVKQALIPPGSEAINAFAHEIHHPILAPIDIDLRGEIAPEAAAVLAVLLNPDLRAERARRQLADAQLLQAGILPNPQLSAVLDLPFNNDSADSFTGYSLGLSWDITALLTRRQLQRAASAEQQSVALDVAWKEWLAAESAKTAAYDVIAINAELEDARRADQQFEQGAELVRRAVENHDKTIVELSAAEATFHDSRATLLLLERELEQSRIALNRSLGLPADFQIRLRSGALPSRMQVPSNEALENFEAHRLDLIALRSGYDSQDATYRAAIIGQFPKINFGVTAARDTSRVNTIAPAATVDLPIFDRNQGAIATQLATRDRLFEEFVSRVFAARTDLAAALADIQSTNEQLAAAEAALPSFEKLAETYRGELKRGNVDVLSSYTAETAALQRRIDVTRLKRQLVQDWIKLELASGQVLPMTQSNPATEAAR